jgi:enterochelin esterase-like enzyme
MVFCTKKYNLIRTKIMKNFILISILLLIVTTNAFAQNTGDSPQTKLGFTTTIHSQVFNDSINIFTHLPFNYRDGKEFPVIILLDAHTTFKAFSSCTELMAYSRSIPTCIVVGFPQYKYANFNVSNINNKMKSIGKFIEQELFPHLNSKYSISKTLIWGQGSEITTYLMLDKPNLFDGYIADSPDLTLISDKVNSENAFKNFSNNKVSYFLFRNKANNTNNSSFLNNLKSNAPKELNWHYNISDESNMIIYLMNNYMHALEQFFNNK